MLTHQIPKFGGIAVTAHGRTGSSWLHALLASHPDLKLIGGEPFQVGYDYDKWESQNKTPASYLKHLCESKPIAIKYMWPAYCRFNIVTDFRKLGFKFVHPYRRRLLDVYVSAYFHCHKNLNRNRDQILINRQRFEHFVKQYSHVQRKLRVIIPEAYVVCYEDLRADQERVLSAAMDHLGLRQACLYSDRQKILKRSLPEMIVNFAKVKDLANRIYNIEN